jgi:hypothetical protein
MPNHDWTCPFCNRHATITAESIDSELTYLKTGNSEGHRALLTTFTVCPNPKCKRFTLTAALFKAGRDPNHQWQVGEHLRDWTLIPASRAQSFPAYIPKAIIEDYGEACLIRDLSPKASATLSRRCLQGMIRDFWQVKAGRLVDEIAAIKDKVDPLTWQAIDAVRKVGNIGAHMEADINVIVDVEPNEAALLIGLVEALLKDWYMARETKKEHLTSLVRLSAQKDNDKKQKPSS